MQRNSYFDCSDSDSSLSDDEDDQRSSEKVKKGKVTRTGFMLKKVSHPLEYVHKMMMYDFLTFTRLKQKLLAVNCPEFRLFLQRIQFLQSLFYTFKFHLFAETVKRLDKSCMSSYS